MVLYRVMSLTHETTSLSPPFPSSPTLALSGNSDMVSLMFNMIFTGTLQTVELLPYDEISMFRWNSNPFDLSDSGSGYGLLPRAHLHNGTNAHLLATTYRTSPSLSLFSLFFLFSPGAHSFSLGV